MTASPRTTAAASTKPTPPARRTRSLQLKWDALTSKKAAQAIWVPGQKKQRKLDLEHRKMVIEQCLAWKGTGMTARQMLKLGKGPCFMWPDQPDQKQVLVSLKSLLCRLVKAYPLTFKAEVQQKTSGSPDKSAASPKTFVYSLMPSTAHISAGVAFADSMGAPPRTEIDWAGPGHTVTTPDEMRKLAYNYQQYTEPTKAGEDFRNVAHIGDTDSGKTVLQSTYLRWEYEIQVALGNKQTGLIKQRYVTSYNWKVRKSMDTARVTGHDVHTEAWMKAQPALNDVSVAKDWTSLALNQHCGNFSVAPFTDVDSAGTIKFVDACTRTDPAVMHTMLWDDMNTTKTVMAADGFVATGNSKGQLKTKTVKAGPLHCKAFQEKMKDGSRAKLRMVMLAHQASDFVKGGKSGMTWNDWNVGTFFISFKSTPDDSKGSGFFDKHVGKQGEGLTALIITAFTSKWDAKYGAGTGVKAWAMLKNWLVENVKDRDTLVWYSKCELPDNWLSAWKPFVFIKASACKDAADEVNALAAADPSSTTLLDALSRRSAGRLFKEEEVEQPNELADWSSDVDDDFDDDDDADKFIDSEEEEDAEE